MSTVLIDRRPMWRILLSRSVRPAFLALLALCFWAVVGLDPPEALGEGGLHTLAIFGLCMVLWVTGTLPVAVTGLLAVALIALFEVMERREVFALFGSEAIFFFLGVFILAAAMHRTGLSARLTLVFIRRFGSGEGPGAARRLLLGMLLSTALFSFVIPAPAVAAMMFPMLLEIGRALRLDPRASRYGKALSLALGWGAAIGGTATLLGGSRLPLALEIFHKTTGQSVSFSEYLVAAVPLVAVLLPLAYLTLLRFFRPEVDSIAGAREALERRNRELGKLRADEVLVALLVVLTVAGWIALGRDRGLANIAITSVVAVFALRLLQWKEVEGFVNWGVILMYGGAICLGAALHQTGAARWTAEETLGGLTGAPFTAVIAISLLTRFLAEGMSHAGVVAAVLPLSLILPAGGDPRLMFYTVAILSGIAFLFPAGSPVLALAYSAGYLRVRDVILPGLLLGVASLIVFLLVARFYWPLLGIGVPG